MTRSAGWLIALGLLAACGDGILPPQGADATFHLATDDVWTDGEIVIEALGVDLTLDPPQVTLDGAPLEVISVEPALARYRAPDHAGSWPLRLEHAAAGPHDLGLLTVYGYLDTRTYQTEYRGLARRWPRGSPVPSVLVHGRDGLSRLDLRTGAPQLLIPYDLTPPPWTGGSHYACMFGPGPTADPDVWVFCGGAWQLWPSIALHPADSIETDRMAIRTSTGAQIILYKHDVRALAPGAPVEQSRWWFTEESPDLVLSPRGDRIAVHAYDHVRPESAGLPVGYPVFDADAQVAFTVDDGGNRTDARGGWVPAFSSAGDTLFLAVTHRPYGAGSDSLLILDADAGTPMAAIPLFARSYGITVADEGPWLFVGGWDGALFDAVPVVTIVDRTVPSVVAVLRATRGAERADLPVIVPSPSEGMLYVLESETGPATQGGFRPVTVHRFTLPR